MTAQRDPERPTKALLPLPVHAMGTIEDIGPAAEFPMTNPYVTGAVLEVSGGEALVTLNS